MTIDFSKFYPKASNLDLVISSTYTPKLAALVIVKSRRESESRMNISTYLYIQRPHWEDTVQDRQFYIIGLVDLYSNPSSHCQSQIRHR